MRSASRRCRWGMASSTAARRALGGLDTLEALAMRNADKYGDTRMTLDKSDRPTYTFADGNRRRALGVAEFTVEAGGQPGAMRVHSMPIAESPMLIGMTTLRRMGAIIDFDKGLAVFERIAPQKVVQLERAVTGHLLLDCSEDLLKGEVAGNTTRADRLLDLSRSGSAQYTDTETACATASSSVAANAQDSLERARYKLPRHPQKRRNHNREQARAARGRGGRPLQAAMRARSQPPGAGPSGGPP